MGLGGRQGWGCGKLAQKDQVSWIVIGGASQNVLVSRALPWVFASLWGGLGVCRETPVLPTSHALTRSEHPEVIPIPLHSLS